MSGDLDVVAARVLDGVPRRGRALVAVDGVGASGKTTVAVSLARLLGARRPVVELHADDFFRPNAVRRARGPRSPEGFWLDAYDHESLTAWALTPLGPGGDGVYCASSYDPRTDRTVRPEPRQAPPDALVLVEGTFLHRDELVAWWDLSVYLDIPLAESDRRMSLRDGLDPGSTSRYRDAQRLYFAAAAPWDRASLVVDTTDLDAPRLIEPGAVAALR